MIEPGQIRLRPDATRVVIRPLNLAIEPRDIHPVDNRRVRRIVEVVQGMDNRTVQAELSLVLHDFENRHREIRSVFEERFEQIAASIGLTQRLRTAQRQLIGAYFCHEYSFEAAAIMNPSLVPHPDQSGLDEGDLRFVLSLRAVGEGHISSITFREGILHRDGTMAIASVSRFSVAAATELDGQGGVRFRSLRSQCGLDEIILFPATPAQRNGLEDLRLVRFHQDDGSTCYYGTYTAYSGRSIASEMLHTETFRTFDLRPMTGSASCNKGMALFPRKLGGHYCMIGRQDNENLYLLRSEDLYHWEHGELLAAPQHPWDLVQIGNCGAPIELEEGWLVLTHGVGPMRKYSIGAILLDKQDPSRVIARSKTPLLSPSDEEREGYVPNVVYSCGALVHGDFLLLPYGVADSSVSFALFALKGLLDRLSPVA